MRLNQSIATSKDEARLYVNIQRRLCQRDLLAGLPYEDELAGQGGIHLEILAHADTSEETIKQAIRAGYSERDVVSHSTLICPAEWFIVD